jgi:hypothetical protein
MIRKTTIVHLIFLIALCYIISPWFFEKRLLFNELLSAIGILVLVYKGAPLIKSPIYIAISLLILWGGVHCVISLFRMDSLYYYLRNTVIVYSIFPFFIGFFCLSYLEGFIKRMRTFLRLYIGIFLFFPVSTFLFERYGMATLFPALPGKGRSPWVLPFLVVINMIYAVTYKSSTSFVLSIFYCLLLISPGYKFFKQVLILAFISFCIFFISVLPNLSLIQYNFSVYDEVAIKNVMHSNFILDLDPNNTWRLVLWKQILVDHFPQNIFGIGFGTPAVAYYPVADFSKLDTLPYVLGAHNSFIYLFGRLGIVYLLLIVPVHVIIFKEYFFHKFYYRNNNGILLFYSFFAISMITLFNPTLESPIFAAGYWLVLGLLARCIYFRQLISKLKPEDENLVYS